MRLLGNHPSIGGLHSCNPVSVYDTQSSGTQPQHNFADSDSDEYLLFKLTSTGRTSHENRGCLAEVPRALGAVPKVGRVRGGWASAQPTDEMEGRTRLSDEPKPMLLTIDSAPCTTWLWNVLRSSDIRHAQRSIPRSLLTSGMHAQEPSELRFQSNGLVKCVRFFRTLNCFHAMDSHAVLIGLPNNTTLLICL